MKDYIELKVLNRDVSDAQRIFRSIGLLFLLEDLHNEVMNDRYIEVLGLRDDSKFPNEFFAESDFEIKQRIVYEYFQKQEPDSYIKKHKQPLLYKMKSAAQREVIQKIWQERRLPGRMAKSYSGKYHHNKTTGLPWSNKARDLHFSTESVGNSLVLEHAKPIYLMVSDLREAYGVSVVDAETMHQFLLNEHENTLLCVITKEEDNILTSSGHRVSNPDYAWERYEAIGGKDSFLYLEDDSRFKG